MTSPAVIHLTLSDSDIDFESLSTAVNSKKSSKVRINEQQCVCNQHTNTAADDDDSNDDEPE